MLNIKLNMKRVIKLNEKLMRRDLLSLLACYENIRQLYIAKSACSQLAVSL